MSIKDEKQLDPLSQGVVMPQMRPICPSCGTDPVPIACNLISLDGAFAAVFFCGLCRKVLGVGPLPDPVPRPAPTTGMIVRPS